ncbi:hypothetical protein QYE76_062884 [Lolium multiflorum]|uniref:Transposase (putative) gypsy type domain-containing protein n=1 Tax=Lolium multiflorum TaxID=4521 RepID=A0AAD8W8J3_LOLMU|nr:hypothetical protein QYE76_062884 [Lolium multiflorum]
MAAADLGAAEWERSKITNQDLNLLKKLGISKKPKAVCFPSEESYPTPPMGYRVSFVDHLIRGLSAPIHPFLRGLLFVYGLQLHHLTPNSILHISIFITLCEAFLGVQPNWALWKRIFFCRRNGSANVAYNIGGVVISVRSSVNYFDVKLPDSVQGWRKKWLYIREENHGCAEDNIPPFDGAEKILRRRSWDAEATEEERTSTEALMTRIHELQNTRGKELSGIQITAYFLRTRVQPLQARKNPFWNYAGDEDTDRLSTNLEVKDLDRLIRKISSLKKKDPIPSTYRVKPYSATNALPKEDASEATASAQSPPPAVSPKNKRKRNDAEDSGTSKPEEAVPSRQKAAYDPYLETLISSDDEEEVPTADVAARTSTSHTLVASETPVEGEETSPPQQNVGAATPPSSPLVPSPKRARVETIPEPTLQSSSSSNPLLDDPTIKELLRIGAQFLGYRDYASKTEEKLAEVNERANTLAQKLEQSEEARKKAESDAVEARQEADKAKADAAGVEDLRKRLHDAETSLSDHIAAQIAREEAITKRIRTQNRRFIRPLKNLNLRIPTMILFLTPFRSLNFMGRKRCFNPPEDLGLKMRHENMKVAVESTVALVADSQQTIDWAKVGNTEQIEQTKCLPPPFGTAAIVLLAIIRSSREELKELRGQLQSVKKQSLMLMEQSRESSEREKIALQQAQAAIAEKDSAVAEAAAATSRENSMLQLLIDASLDMAETIGAFLDAATEDERVEARSNVLLRLAREHGSTFWGTPERTRQIVRFQDRALQIVPKCLEKMSKRKRNFGKYDDIVTPVAEDMMDELLRMDAEFFVKGSYAEHSTRAVNNERLTIDNILGNP